MNEFIAEFVLPVRLLNCHRMIFPCLVGEKKNNRVYRVERHNSVGLPEVHGFLALYEAQIQLSPASFGTIIMVRNVIKVFEIKLEQQVQHVKKQQICTI